MALVAPAAVTVVTTATVTMKLATTLVAVALPAVSDLVVVAVVCWIVNRAGNLILVVVATGTVVTAVVTLVSPPDVTLAVPVAVVPAVNQAAVVAAVDWRA